MREFQSPRELAAVIGERIGPGEWITITQKMIDGFAEATGDRQWIHVDVERAKTKAPGGKTIAHGYLLLSLLGTLQPTIYAVRAPRTVNYGINKLRFLIAAPVDSRVRLSEVIRSVEQASGGLRVTSEITIELENTEKPALVAEIVFVYFE